MKWLARLTELDSRGTANVLSDGVLAVAYVDVPDCFAALGRVLAADHCVPEAVVALAMDNTVPAALTLLYLLEHDYSVLLLTHDATLSTLPLFCRYFLHCHTLTPHDYQALPSATFLTITANPAWDSNSAVNARAQLFLRTSGSTGTPKMAVYTHTKLHANVRHCVSRFGLNNADRVAIPVPLSHMFGLGAAFLPSVAAGAAVDLQKGANLLKFIQRETAFNPNVAFMTPAFANTLLQTRNTPRPYRLTVTAGDRFRAERFAHYEAAFGPLVQLYGSTELGAIAAGHPGLPMAVRQHSAGLPMPDVALRLQSPNTTPSVSSTAGELWCKRNNGFDGYVDECGHPLDLGADYDAGWFRTKDFARLSLEGYVEVLGRSDHSVNRDGLLVFFADLEKTIETLEQVATVAVVTGAESARGQQLFAYCVLNKNSNLTAAMVRAHCFAKLPRHAVPDEIRLCDSLPLLPNGKVDRIALQNITNCI